MGVPARQIYTEEDYYNMSEDIRAEIIDGQIYYQDAPSRVHQEILGKLFTVISNHIKSKGGSCKVYPAPYTFKDKVKANIYEDLEIDFSEIDIY